VREIIVAVSDAVAAPTPSPVIESGPTGLELLDAMGFPPDIGPKALRQAGYDTDRAVEIALQMVTELGVAPVDRPPTRTGPQAPATNGALQKLPLPLRPMPCSPILIISPSAGNRTAVINTAYHRHFEIGTPVHKALNGAGWGFPSGQTFVDTESADGSIATPRSSSGSDVGGSVARTLSILQRLRDHGIERQQQGSLPPPSPVASPDVMLAPPPILSIVTHKRCEGQSPRPGGAQPMVSRASPRAS